MELTETLDEPAKLAAELCAEADYILISVGAGLSAAAGVDYTDRELFKRFFPDMHQRGFRYMYQFIGFREWSDELKWSYISRQALEVRFGNRMVTKDTYDQLVQLVTGRPYDKPWAQKKKKEEEENDEKKAAPSFFSSPPLDDEVRGVDEGVFHQLKCSFFCATSNVDGLLHRNGHFPRDSVCEMQGTYSHMQCLKPCKKNAVWPSKKILQKIRQEIGADSGCVRDTDVPKCPHCGYDAFLQVRGGSWFTEWPQEGEREKWKTWVAQVLKSTSGDNESPKKLVILELGAGFNTPSVLRWPNEHLARACQPNATLIRINTDHPETPKDINALSVSADLHTFLSLAAKYRLQIPH